MYLFLRRKGREDIISEIKALIEAYQQPKVDALNKSTNLKIEDKWYKSGDEESMAAKLKEWGF